MRECIQTFVQFLHQMQNLRMAAHVKRLFQWEIGCSLEKSPLRPGRCCLRPKSKLDQKDLQLLARLRANGGVRPRPEKNDIARLHSLFGRIACQRTFVTFDKPDALAGRSRKRMRLLVSTCDKRYALHGKNHLSELSINLVSMQRWPLLSCIPFSYPLL